MARPRESDGRRRVRPRVEVVGRAGNGHGLRLAGVAVESITEGVMITDPRLDILAVNRALCEMTGYGEAEVIGQQPSLLQSGRHDAAFYEEMWAAIDDEGRWQGEIWNRRKNGTRLPGAAVASGSSATSRGGDELRRRPLGPQRDQGERGAFRVPRPPRSAHRTAQPAALRGAGRARPGQARCDGGRARRDVHRPRPRPLQAPRRHPRPPRRGRAAPPGGRATGSLRAGRRHRRSTERRRVHGAAAELSDAGSAGVGRAPDPRRAGRPVPPRRQRDLRHRLHRRQRLPRGRRRPHHAHGAGRSAMDRAKEQAVAACSSTPPSSPARRRSASAWRAACARRSATRSSSSTSSRRYRSGPARIVGVEALIRWRHPELGLVLPPPFHPARRGTGLAEGIGAWVMREACRRRSLDRRGPARAAGGGQPLGAGDLAPSLTERIAAASTRAASTPAARDRDHRGLGDGQPRGCGRARSARSRRSASRSPSTISAPATRRSTTCGAFPSTG